MCGAPVLEQDKEEERRHKDDGGQEGEQGEEIVEALAEIPHGASHVTMAADNKGRPEGARESNIWKLGSGPTQRQIGYHIDDRYLGGKGHVGQGERISSTHGNDGKHDEDLWISPIAIARNKET